MSEFKQQLWPMDMLPKDMLIDKIKRLEQALEAIKEIALSAPAIDSEFSLRVLEKCEVIDD